MSIIDIHAFTVSGALLSNTSESSALLSYLRGCEGCTSAMLGFPIEDKTRAYLLSTWSTYPNSELATSNPKFDALLQPLLASGESNLETYHHILPDVEYLPAIKAPLTEISTFRLLPGQDFAAGQQQMDDIIAEIKTHTPRAKGIHAPIVWGRAGGVDVSAPSVMLIGWDDVEDHWNANKLVPVDSLIEKLFTLADIKVMHVSWCSV